MASENNDQCISAWVFLGFAILVKGPVAFVLALLTITSFLFCQKNWETLLSKINPKKGFLITILKCSVVRIRTSKRGKAFFR